MAKYQLRFEKKTFKWFKKDIYNNFTEYSDDPTKNKMTKEDISKVWDTTLNNNVGGWEKVEVKIGLNPNNKEDMDKIYYYYNNIIMGKASRGQVETVCNKIDKDGGKYVYNGENIKMYHCSHGTGGTNNKKNSDDSRTAWLIKNKFEEDRIEVVGIGMHNSNQRNELFYKAIFPNSSDNQFNTVNDKVKLNITVNGK